jgi:excisionase family DNA binding protein
MTLPRLISYERAAAMMDPYGELGITVRTIERLIRERKLSKFKIGRKPAVRESDVNNLIERREQWFKSTNRESEKATGPVSSGDTLAGSNGRSQQTRQTRAALSRIGTGSKKNSGTVHHLDAARHSRN